MPTSKPGSRQAAPAGASTDSSGIVQKLLRKYGAELSAAHEAHKNDETEYGKNFQNLPPDLSGVAQLDDIGFREIPMGKNRPNEGGIEFFASAVVKEPFTHAWVEDKNLPPQSMKVFGLKTFINKPVCATSSKDGSFSKTLDQNLAWIYNMLRILGYPTHTMGKDPGEMVAAAEVLKNAGKPIYVRFHTWKPAKREGDTNEPRTQHFWDEPAEEGYVPQDYSSYQEVDNSAATRKAVSKNGAVPANTATAPSEEFDEFGGLEDLVVLANGKNGVPKVEAARKELTEKALALGYSEHDVKEVADTWAEVVEWIRSGPKAGESAKEAEEAAGEAEGAEDAIPMPEKDQVWRTRLPDAKGKKSAQLSQVLVTAVDTSSGKCDVKDLKTKKVHKDIGFDELVSVDD